MLALSEGVFQSVSMCEDQGSFMSDEVLKDAPIPAVKITVRPNGPFRVEGPISLVDVNGRSGI